MTREEWHEEIDCRTDYIGWHNAHEMADKMFDKLEIMFLGIEKTAKIQHELMITAEARGVRKCEEEFKSMVCENCKWYNGWYCKEPYLIYKFDGMADHKDFGCNKFVRKQQ